MLKKKTVFITASDIFDEYGNGGSKGSRKNYDILVKNVGVDNIYVIQFVLPGYKTGNLMESHIIRISQPCNNFQALYASVWGLKKYMPGAQKKVERFIKKVTPDTVFYDGSVIGKLIKHNAPYKQVVFLHNVEVDYSWNKVKNEGIQFFPAFLATLRNERRIIYADKIGCLNKRDASIVKRLYSVETDFYLPVTFKDSFDRKRVREPMKNRILFLGSCFGPNIDGIEWFIRNVIPRIPNIHLDIVGKGFEEKKVEYERISNVHVVGSVDDSSDYYYSHSVVVMPILYGAGMKVKTAEAMMYGKCIIASDEALEGYEVENVEGVVRCNSVEEFVVAITRNVLKNEKIYPAVRDTFLQKYETTILYDVIKSVI